MEPHRVDVPRYDESVFLWCVGVNSCIERVGEGVAEDRGKVGVTELGCDGFNVSVDSRGYESPIDWVWARGGESDRVCGCGGGGGGWEMFFICH